MAKPITFAFFRKNCKTCEKALAHLNALGVDLPDNAEDARKVRKTQEEMISLAKNHKRVISTKGTKVTEVDLKKEKPTPAALLGLMVGPSGNLRAPTISVSGTLLVGFTPDSYDQVLK